jgi:hypothetical protein
VPTDVSGGVFISLTYFAGGDNRLLRDVRTLFTKLYGVTFQNTATLTLLPVKASCMKQDKRRWDFVRVNHS